MAQGVEPPSPAPKPKHANRLAKETSPYLLQHAHNPVDWYPWGEEALARARQEDKPILLSIGYSACHWCHVMAHESFEDEETAALMNRHFVNIKVDREERPDLDRIYQTAHQLMMQRGGGWPLTVVLDPKTQAPFFAGTYFPREPRHGLPAFRYVLQHVADWYAQNKDQLGEQDRRLREVLQRLEPVAEGRQVLSDAPLGQAFLQLERNFDSEHGGFSDAPKFPHAPQIELLLRLWARAPQRYGAALSMALFTLHRMCEGGLFDHLGGGFCRYSVDAQWMIPHFEKMLYDNGPLLALCSAAARIGSDPVFTQAASLTADWVLREMQSPEGGFYSSLDADSEGHEGKYYVWTREEVAGTLPDEDYRLFAQRFGLDRAPNFEGQWHLHGYESVDRLAKASGQSPEAIRERLAYCRKTLFDLREKRVRPGRDDKILTSWNALMIQGLAAAARQLGRADCLHAAQRALDFIHCTLYRDGRLLATYKDGKAHLTAYLDDYALLLEAVLELLQLRWRGADLAFARELAEALLTHFEDRTHGGFFFTAHDHEKLLARMKPLADEALPSGNGIAARALNRLGWLLGETRYLHAAERTLQLAFPAMQNHPLAYPTLLMALQEALNPPEILILRGTPERLRDWQAALAQNHALQRLIFAIPADAAELPAALADKKPQGEIVAYRCRGLQCSAPVSRLEELAAG
ncbi:MAG TPA: thioredoxin domain-containing protein [Nevskiales bacterium]|nr:thioredoxin domain-containing protein [Nevskiales bacterium]